MSEALLDLAMDAVARARRLGASAADALALERRALEIEVREGAIEKLEQAEAREIGLRVFVGQSSAIVAGSALDAGSLDRLADMAVAMARSAPPDPHGGLAETADLCGQAPDLDLVSNDVPTPEDLKRLALSAEAAASGIDGVAKSGGAGASYADRSSAVAGTNGLARVSRRTTFSLSASAIAGEGTGMERDYDVSTALHRGDLRAAEDVGQTAGRRAVRRLNPRKVTSQAVPVIFDRRVASSLIGHFVSAILGSAVARGTSFLKDRLGQRVFAETITITDDPLRRRGLGSRAVDGEGIAAQPRALINRGSLTTWLLDLNSARQLGLRSTGHAARSLASPPAPASSNVHVHPGRLSPAEMIGSITRGLLVTELIGMGVNPVTGDYSRGASGLWIENGEVAYPVSEITIAGNLKDMFMALTPANDLEFRTSTNAPSLMVEGLTVAGA